MIRNGMAYYVGLSTCGRVHLCPCCGAKIRQARSDELQAAGTAWEGRKHGVAMVTFTMRHYRRTPLDVLVKQQGAAWKRAFGQNALKSWKTYRASMGITGYVRAWEVTHGSSGWHPHYHVLFFLDRPWTADQAAQVQKVMFGQWAAALRAEGAYPVVERGADGKPVGVKVDVAGRGESGALSRYLMKYQDGKAGWTTGDELTRQDVKSGRSGNRLPFEIIRAFADTGDAGDLALWHEYERAAHGIRALYWSQGLRKKLGALVELDERTNGEVAAEVPADGEALALVPAQTWHRHVVRHRGRSLALLHAAESLGTVGVRTLIESWGLVWGSDVLPAPIETE